MKKFSTLSLILGIVGLVTSFFLIGLIPCIIAVIFGILHIVKIRKSFGKSIAGISCALIGLFISVIMIIAISLPSSNTDNHSDIPKETTISEIEVPSSENESSAHIENQTEPPTEKQTEPPTEKQTEKQTEPPTEKQTEPPTEKQTEPPTEKQTEPPTEKQTLVWIVEGGTRYHCKSTCSNMRSPYQVPLETAQSYGLTACKRCY